MQIIRTFELRRDGVTWGTGTVRFLAEFAALEVHRKDATVPDEDLDALEKSLRKARTAEHGGKVWSIVPIVEAYEADEEG